jgi:hypothetical protein
MMSNESRRAMMGRWQLVFFFEDPEEKKCVARNYYVTDQSVCRCRFVTGTIFVRAPQKISTHMLKNMEASWRRAARPSQLVTWAINCFAFFPAPIFASYSSLAKALL